MNSGSGQAVPARSTEPRWPIILAVLAVLALVESLPNRYEFGPPWFAWAVVGIVVASMLTVSFAPTSLLWHRVQRLIVLGFSALICVMGILAVVRLVADMITHHRDYSSITLLESAIVIWTVNIVTFALLYWQLNRAGPEARAAGAQGAADFCFAESDARAPAPAWEPHFVDYLFLAFTTSTSFTPPDYARPASRRAKLFLVLQALISLTTLFLIAARAIATLS